MKNYKMLVPVVLIAISVLSVYQLFSENLKQMEQYNKNLQKARYCAKVGIVDAADYYEAALKIKKSIDVYEEYAEFYIDQNDYSDAESIAERMSADFPGNSKSYDLLMTIYETNNDYTNLFQIYEETQNKKIYSATIDEIYQNNEFVYYTNGKRYTDVKSIFNGYYAVCNSKGYWGYTNRTGSVQIGCQYDYAGGFSSEMASVRNQEDQLYYVNTDNGKKFVFDTDKSYDYLGQIVDDIYVVGNKGTYAYYNTSFKKLFGDYEYAGTFNCGIAAVKKDGSWILIDKSGKEISDTYSDILMDDNDVACKNNRVIAVKDGIYYILNEKAEIIKKTDFEEIAYLGADNMIAFKKADLWGFCDENGDVIIEPEYDGARSFSSGLATVCKNDKWGYINENNEIVIDYTFTAANDFNSAGCAYVSDDSDSWYMIKLYKYNHG